MERKFGSAPTPSTSTTLAHVMALRVFPSQRQVIISQIPMLVLMVAYTCLGLWVLSLPLGTPQVLPLG
jgi:hypothetical protein